MYKLSNYNYFVPDVDKVVYLNGITSKIFAVTREENVQLQHLFQNLDVFYRKYPSIFHFFLQRGFIIPENRDEIKILRYRNRQAVFGDRNYLLVINPTLECNFRCWYCYEEHRQGSMTLETMEKVKKHIRNMVEKERICSLNLTWFGGEPLLYFKEVMYPLAVYAKELCMKNNIPYQSNITTNGFLLNEEIVMQMKELNFQSFQITLDGDEQKHNKIRNANGRASFRTIIENINMLLKHLDYTRVRLRVNYDAKTLDVSDWDGVLELLDKKYRDRIMVAFHRVWQTANLIKGENNEILKLNRLCKEKGYCQRSVSNTFFLNRDHVCYADRFYHAEINYDGKVYRCTARDYSDKHVVGKLEDDGTIRWDEEKMSARYGKATFENKHCLSCRYLPLCLGPCSQRMIEQSGEEWEKICNLKHAEILPETMILEHYHNLCEQARACENV